MAKEKQAVIIRDNRQEATGFISGMENTYLVAIEQVTNSLKEMGINPEKNMISEAVSHDNFNLIEVAYKEVYEADLNTFKTKAGREQILDVFKSQVENLKRDVKEMFSGRVGNFDAGTRHSNFDELVSHWMDKVGTIPMSSFSLNQFWELNPEGVPFIPEQSRQAILDAFTEYASPEEIKISEAQNKAASALNEFFGVLSETGQLNNFDPKVMVFLYAWFNRYFTLEETKSGFKITANTKGLR